MNNLHIKERQMENVVVLDMDGNMRIGEGGVVFHETIRRLLEEGRRKILLNLSGVDYIDSSGLGELIASHNVLKKNGGQVKLLHLTKRVRELMVITKLLTIFDVYESESEALESFNSPEPKIDELQPALV
ncbi:MAG TPA: STAS domain-containing protein [Pyrinomonadaceae bacterium]|nr:STAS domain-containing protein [Pyrinomonadaceae bacterium]